MELEEIRKKIAEKYLEIDKKSGELFLLAVLFEEVGELAEVVRKRDVEKIEEELCDVLFMILSLANYFGVNPEKRLVEKYIKDDPSSRWDLP
ncbi:MazG nucleotide pyrophosphohydrolase [Ferroglobus placidus DSM 10642]|uniref:MazG nucleotide pyrophosphohydrolase n=1 Tax=Ferroglobus placidus (strain DSM 10642 / AEDII12DO) TaxID=589924 RepID=D3RYY8_FERPA|nr:MazG nucleotide pyrophosphohydrolase domain-containing protein [Ferroglobus placidus]ADC65701.1 MazG nucleotide pyrophosphohydrolase [Ferroglobus placidus DSM 10642]